MICRMIKKWKMIYINASRNENRLICSGISFSNFIEHLRDPIKNIILIKGNFPGNKQIKNFELVEGEKHIAKLKKEDVYTYGDFCFVDYNISNSVYQLTNEQVAELLFMAHMFEPLKSPFFEVLNNRFAYLAHDDWHFCVLYSRDIDDFLDVLNGTIASTMKDITKRYVKSFDNKIIRD